MKKYVFASLLGAFCFVSSAQAVVINLSSSMTCDKANAGLGTCAAGGSGTGSATMTYDTVTRQLNWNISFSGLSGTVTVAHFHGPALPSQNAPPVVTIGTPPANPAVGSATLTLAQEADMLAGLWYINIHSTAFLAGEIRGQVEIDPQFSLYDDFSAGALDPVRWGNASFGRNVLESFKLVTGGALLAGNVGYGDTDSNVGRVAGVTGVALTNTGAPGNLRGLGANVTMLAAIGEECVGNPAAANTRAQVRGIFFNDGSSTGFGDAVGDVGAGINVYNLSNGFSAIEWFVFRCTDATCDSSTDLFANFTTGWTPNVPNFVFILWDPENDQFIFAADSEVAVSPYTPDTLSDSGVPNADFPLHVLRARHNAENCTAGPRSATTFVNFDDVVIGVAVPTP